MSNPPYGMKFNTMYKYYPMDVSPYVYRIDNNRPYNQNYGQAILVHVVDDENNTQYNNHNGEYWMIDTYHITSLSGHYINDKIKSLLDLTNVSSYFVNHACGECYYNACVQLTEDTAKIFTPFFDITDVKYIRDEDASKYNSDDIFKSVHLGREVGFSWDFGDCGVTLVRASAEPVPEFTARKLARDMSKDLIPDCPSDWYIRDFEKYVWQHKDDQSVINIYEQHRDDIAEALNRRDQAIKSRIPYDQMTLFDKEKYC